ncbi:hypothetical protein BY458DRAFT_499274 [Sporodiniella umbellata]|nr:hypothetical protein BY458DRAFT_499274 [Sporodiniella umbellata]
MKLTCLPNELIEAITSYLPINCIAALCLTSKESYLVFLPTLYRHIILGHRLHIKQLILGLSRNSYLKKVASQYGQMLTLKCSQEGTDHRWKEILEQLPNVQHLRLRGYAELPICKIQHMLSALPKVTRLDLRYCNLILRSPSNVVLNRVMEMKIAWTDFTLGAIESLLESLPNLKRATLDANHNRRPEENDLAVLMLPRICPGLQALSISLQQIQESTLCGLVKAYGSQLEQLSLRCESDQLLKEISQHASCLKNLVIRHSGCHLNDVTHILKGCDSLNHFELVSWPVKGVPHVILKRINLSKDTNDLKKTFALSQSDLQAIRRSGFT